LTRHAAQRAEVDGRGVDPAGSAGGDGASGTRTVAGKVACPEREAREARTPSLGQPRTLPKPCNADLLDGGGLAEIGSNRVWPGWSADLLGNRGTRNSELGLHLRVVTHRSARSEENRESATVEAGNR